MRLVHRAALALSLLAHAALPVPAAAVRLAQQQAGSLRGVVLDKDFDVPLRGVQVLVVETRQSTVSGDQGTWSIPEAAPGRYTLVFSKEGYVRQVRADVLVAAGQLTDVDAALAGDFTDMEEFVVEDVLQGGTGTEAALLDLRLDSPALLDSISSELMSRAGVGDAASALRLVSGASTQDGKSAVIRGLPDRYVSSQMNGVRLPSADEDKRAVELDQFPSAAIESIQVAKTFTPDQQGDASGGAVDVRLRGVPAETILQVKTQLGGNSQAAGRGDFLTYDGGGIKRWGDDHGERDPQIGLLGQDWEGAAGTSTDEAPLDYKMSLALGGSREFIGDWRIGGLLSLNYERDSSSYDDGVDESWWQVDPGQPMVPETFQGVPDPTDLSGKYYTGLFDVEQGTQFVQWSTLATIGIQDPRNSVALTWLRTRTTEDVATLAIDTRGKEYFFPGHDPTDVNDPAWDRTFRFAAPFVRFETLEYTERESDTLQLGGRHTLDVDPVRVASWLEARAPELEWVISDNSATLDQPDKRQFGAAWSPAYLDPGVPPFLPPFLEPPIWQPYKPSENINLGNFQRTWKSIEENGEQHSVDLRLPFTQWTGTEGYLKLGVFDDDVTREFDQDSYGNLGDNSDYNGEFDDPWSGVFPDESHPITGSTFDVDYDGDIDLSAWYGMLDLPLFEGLHLVGGARSERTRISVVLDPEVDAIWYRLGDPGFSDLTPGSADVDFDQRDLLPAIGLNWTPLEELTLRAAWSRTVARQTFKELTPVVQQEYLGAPIFIGNPALQMSKLENLDLRADLQPVEGSFFSVSWFKKEIDDPIEYAQQYAGFSYTTAVNYPEGRLSGVEFEARQQLGLLWEALEGIGIGANCTLIDSEVDLPQDEIDDFAAPGVEAPTTSRDMTNAPEFLYNVFITWDVEATGSQFALFYTVQGDTLVAGAGLAQGDTIFVPDVYAREYGTLNFSFTQRLSDHLKLVTQINNLTNPTIKEVYRSKYIDGDQTRSSYSKGVDYSIGLAAEFRF